MLLQHCGQAKLGLITTIVIHSSRQNKTHNCEAAGLGILVLALLFSKSNTELTFWQSLG